MKAKVIATLIVFSLLVLQCVRDPKFDQYFVQGEQLYIRNCSNCHQKNGEGLGLLYPPVKNSDFLDANFEQTLCLMKHGIKGELVVNGKSYNQPMQGIYSLTDLEIAEIATYLYNSGELKRGLIPVTEVTKVMQRCDQ
jgi:cytochrome c551